MKSTTLIPSDADLVAATLRGSREAFGTLVTRHQQTICALAYAKTGSITESEDIAQETFVAAWKNLSRIRTPENFRGWLCGTARNLAAKYHRAAGHSVPLTEDIADADSNGPGKAAITREEETMVWEALARLPENYREPLILFYRSGRTVREVAAALDLSEEAVRQRLSRGRIMLREEMSVKVESILSRSKPGAAFALSVLAAIPALTSPAQAAGAGLAVAKGAGATALTGLAPALGGSLIGIAGAWIGMRGALRRAESKRERQFIARVGGWTISTAIAMTSATFILCLAAGSMQAKHPVLWISLMVANIVFFCSILLGFGFLNNRLQLCIRQEERIRNGLDVSGCDPGFEYRSRLHFLELPLVHIHLRSSGVAKGWFAAGNVAIAPLIAFGGVAVGGIAFGGVAIGVFAMAGIGIGLLSFSALAMGLVAAGGVAIGGAAVGGASWGWLAAMGGMATAKYYAIGHHAVALHANDTAARAFFHDSGFAKAAGMLVTYGFLVQLAIALLHFACVSRLQKHLPQGRPGDAPK